MQSSTPGPRDDHRVMRQSAVILTLGWLLAPLQFLTAVIVARVVGPDGKGALAILTGVTAILVSLVALGIPSGTAALYPGSLHNRREVVGTALGLTATTSCVALALYLLAGPASLKALLSDRDMAAMQPEWILLAVLAVLPTALVAVVDVVLIAANAMGTYALRTGVSGLVGVALTWILTMQLGWGVTGALASYPLAALAGLAVFGSWWRNSAESWPPRAGAASARSLIHVGVQQHAIAMIALVAKRIDVFLLASMLSIQDAGFYAAGILIPQAIMTIPRATVWPLVSMLSAGSAELPDSVARISRLQVALMTVISVVLAVLAPIIVPVLFGDAFGASVVPFQLALLGIPFTPLTVTVNAVLTARARPGLSIGPSLVGTGVQLVMALVLIPAWGPAACAAALSANYIITALLQLVVARWQGIGAAAITIVRVSDLELLVKTLRAWLARDRRG
jgi:O-antigen/teichoic acid export membrane protein